MTSVIRQEWKRRSSNTYTSSIVLAAVNLLALALFYFNPDGGPILPFLPDWVMNELLIPIVILIDTVGFYLGLMFDNASSMKDMLFKDNGYLMKLLPVNSWKLIGGKYITGICELLFFGVQCLVYLLMFGLIASDGEIVISDWSGLTAGNIISFVCMLICALIIVWLFVNTLINMVRTVIAVITKRWKVPKAVIYIVFILITWLTLKWTFTPLFNFLDSIDSVDIGMDLAFSDASSAFMTGVHAGWLADGILMVICGIYYAITCVLYDKFVEV